MELEQLLKNPVIQGDCIPVMKSLPSGLFNTCVTSPPYWGLRDYGIPPSEWSEVTYTPMSGLQPITVPSWTGCLGLEPTPEMFVAHMVMVFREVWRVMQDDGTLWLNFGDSYATNGYKSHSSGTDVAGWDSERRGQSVARTAVSGIKVKDLIGVPWRVAFALQAEGWYLRMDNIWSKTNPMPESVTDRTTKAHEYLFLLSKSGRYYYNADAIKEPGVQDEWANGFRGGAYVEGKTFDNQDSGKRTSRSNFKIPHVFARTVSESPKPGEVEQHRPDREPVEYSGMRNKRSVWTVATQPFPEAHFATFPEKLVEPCILAGCPEGGLVLDPFGGSGTTRRVALENRRECILIELNSDYVKIAERRSSEVQVKLF